MIAATITPISKGLKVSSPGAHGPSAGGVPRGASNGGSPLATCQLWMSPDRIGHVQRVIVEVAAEVLEAAGLKPTSVCTVPPDANQSPILS